MLIKRLYRSEAGHINPNFIIEAWRTRNDLRDSGYEYHVSLLGYNDHFAIDRDSYERIIAWLDAQ